MRWLTESATNVLVSTARPEGAVDERRCSRSDGDATELLELPQPGAQRPVPAEVGTGGGELLDALVV
jgi:hypothetical protein